VDAAGVLLIRAKDPVVATLEAAPFDDEPYTGEELLPRLRMDLGRRPRSSSQNLWSPAESDGISMGVSGCRKPSELNTGGCSHE
jgi:hypothetical protein